LFMKNCSGFDRRCSFVELSLTPQRTLGCQGSINLGPLMVKVACVNDSAGPQIQIWTEVLNLFKREEKRSVYEGKLE
jgi:hypothetical protein